MSTTQIRRGQLKLGAFMYPAGHHVAAGRHPDVLASATTDFAYRANFARKAEAATFDLIFLADGVGVTDHRSHVLSHSDYEGKTLRENLGLKFPVHQPHDLRTGRQQIAAAE
jgi:hypothetical protein